MKKFNSKVNLLLLIAIYMLSSLISVYGVEKTFTMDLRSLNSNVKVKATVLNQPTFMTDDVYTFTKDGETQPFDFDDEVFKNIELDSGHLYQITGNTPIETTEDNGIFLTANFSANIKDSPSSCTVLKSDIINLNSENRGKELKHVNDSITFSGNDPSSLKLNHFNSDTKETSAVTWVSKSQC